VVREDEKKQKYLAAYLVIEDIEVADIKRILNSMLPLYMIPRLVVLGQLPLMPNGKVDRDNLPEPEFTAGQERIPPRDAVEKKLARVWAETLGIDQDVIGVHSNFFELGGHSLKATLLVSSINRELNTQVPLTEIFKNSSLNELAGYIRNRASHRKIVIERTEQKGFYDLSYNQKRLWFLYQKSPRSTALNMPDAVDLPAEVKPVEVKEAVARLIRRHESLRTLFVTVAEKPVQMVVPRVEELPFREVDLSMEEDESAREQAWERLCREETLRVFNLSLAPLLRCLLVTFAENHKTLLFVMHHIISDGWSMEIFKRELLSLLQSGLSGENISTQPLYLSYSDFVQWNNRRMVDTAYGEESHRFWKVMVEEGVPALKLPHNKNFRGDVLAPRGARYRFLIPGELKERLKYLATICNTTLFTIMFATYVIALSRYANQEDVICAVISAGREHEALYPVIGFFINSILFKIRVDKGEPFARFAKRVQGDVADCFIHQGYPLERVFEELRQRYPTIPVAFNMVNMQEAARAVGSTESRGLKYYTPYHIEDTNDTRFDLEPYIFEYKNSIDTMWAYKKGMFSSLTIEYFVKDYVRLLEYFSTNPRHNYENFKSEGKKKKMTLSIK